MRGPVVLSIDASDPTGAGGVQADQRTVERLGGQLVAALTAILPAGPPGDRAVHDLPAAIVKDQLDTVLEESRPASARLGVLTSVPVVRAVARALASCGVPFVLEPAVVHRSGPALLGKASLEAIRRELLPRATIVLLGPGACAAVAGRPVRTEAEAKGAARGIQELGGGTILIHGFGSPDGGPASAGLLDGRTWRRLPGGASPAPGLSLGAAIARFLADGEVPPDAVERAVRALAPG